MGDLHYGENASIEILPSGKNLNAFVLAQYVHPKKIDTFSKVFCGVPTIDKQYWGSEDKVSGRPWGFTFQLPISRFYGLKKSPRLRKKYLQ